MSAKIGRNEPCPCGSGKKYKKCCLVKDETESIARHKAGTLNEWEDSEEWEDKYKTKGFDEDDDFDDFDDFEDDYEDEDDYDDYEDEDDYKDDLDPEIAAEIEKYSKKPDDDYPQLSEEDEEKVDEWWEQYKKIKDPEKIMAHLKGFLASHPMEMVLNLGLEHEVLFELIGDYQKTGKIDEVIDFLLWFRENYPKVYEKSAGYYDFDIIAWLVSKNRGDEIPAYLPLFEKYPINFVDKLFDTLHLLQANGHADYCIPLAKKIYKAIMFSREVMGGYDIANLLVDEIHLSYLKKDYSEKDLESLTSELKNLGLDFMEEFCETSTWKKKLDAYFREFAAWDEKVPPKKQQLFDKMNEITENFMRFLIEEKNLSGQTASYYRRQMNNYYYAISDSKYRLKSLFKFSRDQIEKTVSKLSSDFMWHDTRIAFSLLNTLYFFSEYLFACGNLDEKGRTEVQEITKKFHKMVFNSTKDTDIASTAFEKFPLF